MTSYNALIEVHERDVREQRAEELVERMKPFHPSVSQSARGWLAARVTVPAENLLQAASTAIAVVESATGAQAVASEVMLETEFDARRRFLPLPELVSAGEAAAILGVPHLRINQMIDEGRFPTAQQVGSGYVIARSDVDANVRMAAARAAEAGVLGAGAGVGAAVRAGLRGQE